MSREGSRVLVSAVPDPADLDAETLRERVGSHPFGWSLRKGLHGGPLEEVELNARENARNAVVPLNVLGQSLVVASCGVSEKRVAIVVADVNLTIDSNHSNYPEPEENPVEGRTSYDTDVPGATVAKRRTGRDPDAPDPDALVRIWPWVEPAPPEENRAPRRLTIANPETIRFWWYNEGTDTWRQGGSNYEWHDVTKFSPDHEGPNQKLFVEGLQQGSTTIELDMLGITDGSAARGGAGQPHGVSPATKGK